jgi:hypothetical protein
MTDLVLRFGTSDERRQILDGLLYYRAELYAVGITTGFQWLDGSFLEEIEKLEARAPRDVDVVTFFELPAGQTQADVLNRNRNLFDRKKTKAAYRVDAFPLCLGGAAKPLIERSTCWYSLWSHRRDLRWKGYLEVGLSAAEDAAARANLNVVVGSAL